MTIKKLEVSWARRLTTAILEFREAGGLLETSLGNAVNLFLFSFF